MRAIHIFQMDAKVTLVQLSYPISKCISYLKNEKFCIFIDLAVLISY